VSGRPISLAQDGPPDPNRDGANLAGGVDPSRRAGTVAHAVSARLDDRGQAVVRWVRQVVDAAAGKIICEVVSAAATDRADTLTPQPLASALVPDCETRNEAFASYFVEDGQWQVSLRHPYASDLDCSRDRDCGEQVDYGARAMSRFNRFIGFSQKPTKFRKIFGITHDVVPRSIGVDTPRR
jgi:hypothetical protein